LIARSGVSASITGGPCACDDGTARNSRNGDISAGEGNSVSARIRSGGSTSVGGIRGSSARDFSVCGEGDKDRCILIKTLDGLSTSGGVTANIGHAPCTGGGAVASSGGDVDIGKGGLIDSITSISVGGCSSNIRSKDTSASGLKGRREEINDRGNIIECGDGLVAADKVTALISGSELTVECGTASCSGDWEIT